MQPQPSVVVFDVNETLLDMAPMAERFAEVGAPELAARLWFAVLLRDGFAVAAAGGNEPFARLTGGALRVVLAGTSLNRPADEAAAHVLSGFARLGVHPDVPEGVRILRRQGLRLVTLTNGSADVADRLLTQAGMRTGWIARQQTPYPDYFAAPDLQAQGLAALAEQVVS